MHTHLCIDEAISAETHLLWPVETISSLEAMVASKSIFLIEPYGEGTF